MHRILIEIPIPFTDATIPIFSYGFMMMLAFAVGLTLTHRRAARAGLNPDIVLDLGLYAIVCGIIGARLAFLLTEYETNPTSNHPLLDLVAIWKGGLTFQGGLFLALAVCIWYLVSHKLPAAKIADVFAPGLCIGIAIGRLGCFLNGCCWGQICAPDFPLAANFPPGSPPEVHHHVLLQKGELLPLLDKTGHVEALELLRHAEPFAQHPAGLDLIHVYPTQIYTSLAMVGVFVLVMLADRIRGMFEGFVMLTFLMLYSVVRFMIEWIRDDTPLLLGIGNFPGLRLGQILALLTFLISATAIAYFYRHQKRSSPTQDQESA